MGQKSNVADARPVLLFVLWYLHKRGKESRLLEEDIESKADLLEMGVVPPVKAAEDKSGGDFLPLTLEDRSEKREVIIKERHEAETT